MYIKRLSISNLRSITESTLEFRYPGERPQATNNVNLLLGDNGTGKTTLLGGIALSVLARIVTGSGFRPFHLVRHGAEEHGANLHSELVLHAQDLPPDVAVPQTPVTSRLRIKVRGDENVLVPDEEYAIEKDGSAGGKDVWRLLYGNKEPGWILLGYGATRRVAQAESFDRSEAEKTRSVRFRRVANLFEEHLTLAPLSVWFPQLSGGRRSEITELFNRLLPDEIRFLPQSSRESGCAFQHNGLEVPFSALADGYRAYIGLTGDILYNLLSASRPKWTLDQIPGVVLIDEIDLHLHPSWQRRVLAQLATSLPALQFIVSTHSSIVAGTVPDESLFVLRRQPDGGVTASHPEESIYGKTSDEILLSPFFGLRTTRAPGAVDEMKKLSREALHGDSKAAIELMKRMAPDSSAMRAESPGGSLQTPPSMRLQTNRIHAALVLQVLGFLAVSLSLFIGAASGTWIAVVVGVIFVALGTLIVWSNTRVS